MEGPAIIRGTTRAARAPEQAKTTITRRRTTAATAVDTALHEKVLLGAVQLATALVGGGKPGQTELQRYVTLLAGGTGGKVHIVPCVVPCVVP